MRDNARLLAELEMVEWLAEQTPKFGELALELGAIQTRLKSAQTLELAEFVDSRGRTVYACKCENGYHESLESHEEALESLVDSLRTGPEDLPSTHARIMTWAVLSPKAARERAQLIAKQIRDANPDASFEERSTLFLAKLDSIEAADHAAKTSTAPPLPDQSKL